jgi:hypothetical protein
MRNACLPVLRVGQESWRHPLGFGREDKELRTDRVELRPDMRVEVDTVPPRI